MNVRIVTVGFALFALACGKEDQKNLIDKVVDAAADAPAPAGPKNLDLAKAALATARAKYAEKKASEADCAPLLSFENDFADSTDPEAVKTRHGIDTFCLIDISLDGAVTTLKADNAKLVDAQQKKDKNTVQMYTATVKDNCTQIKGQLDELATKKLADDPKVTMLKADIDPICSPPAAPKKK